MNEGCTQTPVPNSKQHSIPNDHQQVPYFTPYHQLQSPFLSHLPYDCRLIIYHYLLRTPFTRIERRQSPNPRASLYLSAAFSYTQPILCETEGFPYRLTSTSSPQNPTPLSLLLSCRQLYHETIGVLYETTTFIFSLPQDLHCFLTLPPPLALPHIHNIILAYGRVDWRAGGPIYNHSSLDDVTLDPLNHWDHAFKALAILPSLRNLEVYLSHRNNIKSEEARRPREEWMNEESENRHISLFEFMGRVKVNEFTVRMSWNPVDVLEGKEWPFRVELMSADEMGRRKVGEGWPISRGLEGCD